MSKSKLPILKKIIANKSVAVIGNAESILSKTDGAEIDAHDTVIRINMGHIVEPTSQGSKTDVLAFSLPIDPQWINSNFGSPELLWLSPKRRENTDYFESLGQEVGYYPIELWKKLSAYLDGARPSSGLMVIDLIYKMKAARLDLYGFDFKKSKTFYLRDDHIGPHAWDKEQDMARKIVSRIGGSIC